MKKIAIISDIHANLPALEAVLNDIQTNYTTEDIYCLGDLVDAAPWHNEVIELIEARGIPTVMGNHDERIVLNSQVIPMAKHSAEETEARIAAIEYTKTSISDEARAFLGTLHKDIKLKYHNISCLLVHGSPDSNKEYIFEDHEESALIDWFNETKADIILTGHTHYSYIRPVKIDGGVREKLFINVGSVGRSKEKIGAKAVYLWLTIHDNGTVEPTLRKIDYDVEATIKGIKESPISNFYANFFEKHLQD